MRFSPRYLRFLGLLLLPGVLAASELPLVVDFGGTSLPESCRVDPQRKLALRRGQEVLLGPERLGEREVKAARLPEGVGGKFGFRLVLPREDPLFGSLGALGVSLNVLVDNGSTQPVFFQRLRGSYSAPGYFAFTGRRKLPGGAVTLSFATVGEGGRQQADATEAVELPGEAWVQVGMGWDGREVRFYHNGEPVGEPVPLHGAVPGVDSNRCEFAFYQFQGGIGEVVISPNRALEPAQIRSFYLKGVVEFYESFANR